MPEDTLRGDAGYFEPRQMLGKWHVVPAGAADGCRADIR